MQNTDSWHFQTFRFRVRLHFYIRCYSEIKSKYNLASDISCNYFVNLIFSMRFCVQPCTIMFILQSCKISYVVAPTGDFDDVGMHARGC